MRQTVVGIFDSESEAQNAVLKLESDGFMRENIDLSGRMSGDSNRENARDEDFGDKIGNFFNSLFGSDNNDARNYSEVARRGTVVTVHTDSEDEAERAVDILDLYGAVDVNDRVGSYQDNLNDNQYNTTRSSETYGTVNPDLNREYDTDTIRNPNLNTNEEFRESDWDENRTDRENTIPIVEEQMNVGKREVETGGVKVRSRIIERPMEETLRLRTERVNIERNPVNRPANESDIQNFKEGTIEMNQREEVPVVNKEAQVVEEVSVGKNVEEKTETIRDTVRKTEVDVENYDDRDRYRGDDSRINQD